jgi:hypothetical protein
MRREDVTLLTAGLLLVLTALLLITLEPRPTPDALPSQATAVQNQLLTDPFLQYPSPDWGEGGVVYRV